MGFFSYNCKGCGHPLLCTQATTEINAWMTKSVVLFQDGTMAKGQYDGYGRVGGMELLDRISEPECWHEACWKKAGKPLEFTEPSEPANDQGWFFDDGAHDMEEPE